MNLLGDWDSRLRSATEAREVAKQRSITPARVDLPTAAGAILVVRDGGAGDELLRRLQSAPLAAIAIDSEYGYDRPPLELRSGAKWADCRSQRPICVSLAAWLTAEDAGEPDTILRVVLDVRVPEVGPTLAAVLRLRVPFVFHHAKPELFSFWALGLDPDLPSLYDTYLAAAALDLGLHHKRAERENPGVASGASIRAEHELERTKAHGLSLVGQCERYLLAYPCSESKEELRDHFLRLAPGEPLNQRAIEYAAADAEWALRLYAAQQNEIARTGIASHLYTVEFPFAVANARMEWRGLHVEQESRERLRAAAKNAAAHYESALRSYGIDPPGSRDKFLRVMSDAGLLDHFRRDGQSSTEDVVLEPIEQLHPAIRALRMHRRYSRLAGEEWLAGALTGADGRIHPTHRQLGAATGRNSCSAPNIAGIGRVLRPVVTAPPGRALVELDYSQIEVGVAAAEHGDSDLIGAYNSGDVYAAMAQRFYAAALSEEERQIAPRDFKKRQPQRRDAMKTFVLAVIYNIQAPALAARFGISLAEAERERQRFLELYPALQRRLEESVVYGLARGYAQVVSGLRRRVEHPRGASSWMRNFLRNTPIQGSAAVVFKRAVIDLDREFRGTDTWLVLPVHDAIVIECAAADLTAVGERAARIMESALHGYYPALNARVEVNASQPHCWNKDGHADSLDRFLADPGFQFGTTGCAQDADAAISDSVAAEAPPAAPGCRAYQPMLGFGEVVEREAHFA